MLSSFFQIKRISDLTRKCILPLMAIAICLSFYLCVSMDKIHDKSQELVKEVVPNVLATQQSAVHLVQLQKQLERIVVDPDMEHVRQVYSDALMYINEFHDNSNSYLSRNSVDLLFALNHLWQMRVQLDEMRSSVNGSLHYMDTLLRFIALEDPHLFPEVIQLDSNYAELFHRNSKLPNLLQTHRDYEQLINKRREQLQRALTLQEQTLPASREGAESTLSQESSDVEKVVADILALENSYVVSQKQAHQDAQQAKQARQAQQAESLASTPESSSATKAIPVLNKQQELSKEQNKGKDSAIAAPELDDFDWLHRYQDLSRYHQVQNDHDDQKHAAVWKQTIAQMERLAATSAHTQRKADLLDSVVEKALPERDLVDLASGHVSLEQVHKTQALVNNLLVLYRDELKSLEPRWRLFWQLHNSFAYDSHRMLNEVEQILKDYTLDERGVLQGSLREISYLAWELLPLVLVTVGLSLLGFLLVLWMLSRYLIGPIKVIASMLIQFRHTKDISVEKFEHFAMQKHLQEINEIIEVLPHFFDDSLQKSAKSNALEQSYDELQNPSQYDDLTKVCNYNQLNLLVKELGSQTPANFAVAMIDIDFFKKLNESMGRQRGDEVLFAVAHILQNNIAKGDRLFRYEGEKFCLILKDITAVNAFNVATRLCKTIRDLNLLNEGVPNNVVTVSIGISLITTSVGQFRVDELINQADKALYLAKQNGRNQVMACPRSMVVDMSEAHSPKTGYKLAQRAFEADAALAKAAVVSESEPREAAPLGSVPVVVADVNDFVVEGKPASKTEAHQINEMIKGKLAAAAFAKAEENLADITGAIPTVKEAAAATDKSVATSADVSASSSVSTPVKINDGVADNSASVVDSAKSDDSLVAKPRHDSSTAIQVTQGGANLVMSEGARSAEGVANACNMVSSHSFVESLRSKREALEQDEQDSAAPAACSLSPQHLSMLHAKEKLLEQLNDPSVVSNNLAITAGALKQQLGQEPQKFQGRDLAVTGNLLGQQTTYGDNEEAWQDRSVEAFAQTESHVEPKVSSEYDEFQKKERYEETADSTEEFGSAEISLTNQHYGEMVVDAAGQKVDNLKVSPLLVTTAKGIEQEDIVEPTISPQELEQYAKRQTQQRWQAEQAAMQKFEVTPEQDGGLSIYIPANPKQDS